MVGSQQRPNSLDVPPGILRDADVLDCLEQLVHDEATNIIVDLLRGRRKLHPSARGLFVLFHRAASAAEEPGILILEPPPRLESLQVVVAKGGQDVLDVSRAVRSE